MIVDIALPRDVDPAVAARPEVTYLDLDSLRKDGAIVSETEVQAAAAIVDAELGGYLAIQQQLAVAPTVTALRSKANQVVDAELLRLDGRLPSPRPDNAGRGGRGRASGGGKGAARAHGSGQGARHHDRTVTSTPRPCVNSSIWTRPHRSPSRAVRTSPERPQ